MLIRPNEHGKVEPQKVKNDLYRKFKDYFISATEKEFRQFGSYPRKGYCSINPAVEEKVNSTLESTIDEIVPITGPTGIGKTYLLLYCLKERYQVDIIPTNCPQIFPCDGGHDLLYYSDFSITEEMVLKEPDTLILAKIRAMCDKIMGCFGVQEPDVDKFIKENKAEVAYYSEQGQAYQRALFMLTELLNSDMVSINNIVFIFDDLESLDTEDQLSLMRPFLQFYDNLKEKSIGVYHAKFFFCLRKDTYYNLYRQDFYNTHRATKATTLFKAPPLSDIFYSRFNVILNFGKAKKAKNQETWERARDILIDISNRIDSSYNNLLLMLNNNNISNALDDFLSILSNRRWTQRNVNPAASFQISESDYYINDTNVLRILSMGEQNIYFNSKMFPIRCILPDPGVSSSADLMCILLLKAFCQKSRSQTDDSEPSFRLLTEEKLVSIFSNLILGTEEKGNVDKKSRIQETVHDAIIYYRENRLIHINDDPKDVGDVPAYYMMPRGAQIFELFFSQIILFTIFRDTFLLSNKKYSVECSYQLSFSNLLSEAIKYEETLIETETKLFKKVTSNNAWNIYVSIFGTWSASSSFLTGIDKSTRQFYKEGIPAEVSKKIDELQERVDDLVEVFVQFDENTDDLF